MPTVYSLLNKESKNWWYYSTLRKNGQAVEARKLERKAIRDNVKMLRDCLSNGGYVNIGRGGFSLHYSPNGRLEGYGKVDSGIVQAAIKAGITVIDTNTVDDDKIVDVAFNCPLVAFGERKPDPAPYRSMSYAPLAYVVELKRKAGATIYNG